MYAIRSYYDKSTIHRYIVRMIKAGVIKEKVYHGNQNDFELFINPELLLIADLDNPDYIPTSPVITSYSIHYTKLYDCIFLKSSAFS